MVEKGLFDAALDKIPNKYTLTLVSGKRAREIGNGEACLVKTKPKASKVEKALREILAGKIVVGSASALAEEKRLAKEKAELEKDNDQEN